VAPDLVDQRPQLGDDRVELRQIAEEGVLGAEGIPDAIGPDRSLIDAAGYPVIVSAGLAEVRLQERQRLYADVQAGLDSESVETSGSHRTDAVEFADRQGLDERRSGLRRDDVLAVRLAMVGRQLRQELI
jgi:hypothetical protein